jgi:hypothetical protein
VTLPPLVGFLDQSFGGRDLVNRLDFLPPSRSPHAYQRRPGRRALANSARACSNSAWSRARSA